MEHPQVHHSLLGYLLLWMVLCCLVTIVRSDRVMWVDTKGEDGPQCIHYLPVGAPMAQPPPSRSCRSLHYALQNTLNSTFIRITCGAHEYFTSPDIFSKSTFNVQIVGECTTSRPTVQCMDGNVALNGITNVVVKGLVFQMYGRQGDLMLDILNPTLYISNCTNVMIEYITVQVTVPHGTGILLEHTATHGKIGLFNVSILHNGTRGIGILCDIIRNAQSTSDGLTLKMHTILVVNTNTNTTYDPSMVFTGIAITTHGIGRSNITMHNVVVFNSAPVHGCGIFVCFFDSAHESTVNMTGVKVFDGWDKRYHSRRRDEVLAECGKRQLEMLNKTKVATYSAFKVEIWTSLNIIYVHDVQVMASYAPNGCAVAVYFKGLAKFNSIYLGDVFLAATGNTITYRQGLLLHFAGSASENSVITQGLHVINSTAEQGGGALLFFTDQSMKNKVQLQNSTMTRLSSKFGGGLCAVFKSYSQKNWVVVQLMNVTNTTADIGGGMLILLDDFSSGNHFDTDFVTISGNRANTDEGRLARSMFKNHSVTSRGCGGGLIAAFKSHAQNNSILLRALRVEHNTAELGGGIMILQDDFSKGNAVNLYIAQILNNKANAGGGMYIKFHYLSERNNVTLLNCSADNNDLIPHEDYFATGGGINIVFDTYKASSATNNMVRMKNAYIGLNNARGGVGGGISLFYIHSPIIRDSGDKVDVDGTFFWNNQAANGQALALQSSPQYRKALFRGITLKDTWFISFQNYGPQPILSLFDKLYGDLLKNALPELMKQIDPIRQVQVNTNMILLVSVQTRIEAAFVCLCGGVAQGIKAIDSEITLQPNTFPSFAYCVASHGGAAGLYGESYIRFPSASSAQILMHNNFAFQRGGALYVDSAHNMPSHYFHCFLQNDQGPGNSLNGIMMVDNSAKFEGQSVYISDAQSCFNIGLLNRLLFVCKDCTSRNSKRCPPHMHFCRENESERKLRKDNDIPYQNCSETDKFLPVPQQLMFQPNQVNGSDHNMSSVTVQFIPGMQKQLPYTHAYDRLGSVINTVFTAQIILQEAPAPVQLNPFSKYTTDFTVILHGIPLQHGKFSHSLNTNASNTSGTVSMLLLQSVDNNNLLLVISIELQCCPPGYTFRHNSEDAGTCRCGMLTLLGIKECNEINPNDIGAVLQGDHWAGYLPSHDVHSCEGQKLFSAPCPPGYCQAHLTTLPNNNSRQLLDDVICAGSNRKGLLCGDCLEGHSIAVNFNGVRPVCTSCQDGLSTVGVLVWILSEWVPMIIFMFIVMLFNIDLVSGKFNSFLLFAQLLAFSSIRGDGELGSVHIAFVKIYRFLYGMWNLEFLGVLLPPYCLVPNSHLTLLQTLLLHFSIGLFPLIVAITLVVLERSAEKWICCHRVDQCLRRMRRWKAKYSDGMSYDRALPAFVILGFTRFLVSSSYILVNQTITGEDGEERTVVWWQGSVPYGSIQHIAYFIPATAVLLVFVLLPSFVVLTLPIVPQLFGRLIIAVPPLRKLQRMQTFCSNVYTDRWVYHFVNVFQGCYKERFRSFSSLYLFHRITQLLAAVFIPRAEDALHIQLILAVALLLLIAILQPYNSSRLNTLDTAILGNMVLILILSQRILDGNTLTGVKHFYASVRLILIYLPLLYPGILFGREVYVKLKCAQVRCCPKQEVGARDNEEPLLEDPAAGLGNLVNITELRAGLPTSADEDTETTSHTDGL